MANENREFQSSSVGNTECGGLCGHRLCFYLFQQIPVPAVLAVVVVKKDGNSVGQFNAIHFQKV